MRRAGSPLPLAGLLVALAAAGACDSGREAAAPPPPAARPDVVLITVDTLRWDAVGFAGNSRVRTPTLDRLAAAGRVFTDAHAHNVVTLPSHVNILTGLYPFQHGVRDNAGFVLGEEVPTLATLLSAAGYATGAFVAAYPLDRRYGLARGFDLYDDRFRRGTDPAAFVIAERRGDEVVANALGWWRSAAGRPRFLWLHLYDPHAAYEPPEPFASEYRDHPYLGEVAATDAFLTPLLAPHLDGAEPPALVLFTSDHGEALGAHGELTHGLFAYEPTLKVPLVLWGPGVEPGRDGRAARHVDIVPTVLEALALAPPGRLPGHSLLGPPSAGVETYFEALTTALHRGWAPLFGVIRDGVKVVDLPEPELYRLVEDPEERENRYGAEAELARELLARRPATAWPPQRPAAIGDEEAARLRSLGYLVGSAPLREAFGPEDDPKRLVGLDRQIHLAIDHYSRGRFAEAARLGAAIARDRPGMADGYTMGALALRQLERHEEAIALLATGRERTGGDESVVRALGLALAETGRAGRAVELLSPLETTGQPETLRALATALADAGEPERARRVLDRALRELPDDPRAIELAGVIALRDGRPEEARRHLERALELNDELATAWNSLGVALYPIEGPRAALGAWQRAVELDPRQFDALFNLGLVAASVGERELARRALEQFLRTAPPERYAPDFARARGLLVEVAG